MQQRSAATTLTATVAATETNQAVETAFGGAITTDNLNIIKNNIKITYISAALRYLNKMDTDLTGTITGERPSRLFSLRVLRPGVCRAPRAPGRGALLLAHRGGRGPRG